MTPTLEQIIVRNNEYALRRWAEAKGWTRVTTCDQARRVGQGHKENTPHFHKGHNCEHLIPENPNLPSTINHALFADLPMDDEFRKGKFLDHLCKLVGYNMGFTDDADIIIHCIKAPIDQLLLAYYQAGNE